MKDSPNLDLLRSCAVAMVVVSHVGLNLGWASGYDIEVVGAIGVAIFFVHTSLVLMLSLERHGGDAAPFLVRRFFRIYPLAVTLVLYYAAARWRSPVDGWIVLSNVLLVQNLTGHPSMPAPLWSLPYEAQMYLVLPALYALTRLPRELARLALIWAASVGLVVLAWAGGLNYQPLQYVPCFIPGIAAFALVSSRRNVPRPFAPAVLFGIVAVGIASVPALVSAGVPKTPLLWLVSLAVGLAIPMTREITSSPLAKTSKVVATYSYGVYLTHLLSIGFAFAMFPSLPAIARWPIFLAVLPLLAYVAYRWIEKPGIALGIRLADRLASSRRQVRTSNAAR